MKKLFYVALCALILAGCAKKHVAIEQEPMNQHMTGAYTEYRAITAEEQKLFDDTYNGETNLTPISVATQVVAGTNYKYICKDNNGQKYKVVIYQKLPCYGGEAEVTSVEKL